MKYSVNGAVVTIPIYYFWPGLLTEDSPVIKIRIPTFLFRLESIQDWVGAEQIRVSDFVQQFLEEARDNTKLIICYLLLIVSRTYFAQLQYLQMVH